MRALRETGLRVPEDISIVAFDDVPAAWVGDPFLTVVDQPAYEIGRRAAELMLSRLDGTTSGAGRDIVLSSELIVRGSSGVPHAEVPVAPAPVDHAPTPDRRAGAVAVVPAEPAVTTEAAP